MRKFTILMAMVAFASFAFGQKGFVPVAASLSKGEPSKVQKQQIDTELKTSKMIWYEDFAGERWAATSDDGVAVPDSTPENWVLEDFTGEGFYFRWDTVGPRGFWTSPGDSEFFCQDPFDPLYSSTTGNGFMMIEADWYNTIPDCSGMTDPTIGMDATIAYTEPIDFSSYDGIHLIIEHTHRFCCSYGADSDAWFETSTDGGATWTQKSIHVTSINDGAPNASTSEYDITPMISDDTKALSDSVTFRFRLQGVSHYHWEIDDVRFVEPAGNDMRMLDYWNQYVEDVEVDDEFNELSYYEGFYHYPWFVMQEFVSFNAQTLNFGILPQTGVTHNIDIIKNGVVLETFTEDLGDVAVGQEDTTDLNLGTPYEMPGKGVYQIKHYTTTNEGDDVPSNNTMMREMAIGDSVISPVDTTKIDSRMSPDNWTDYVDGMGVAFIANLPDPSRHGNGENDYYKVNGVRVYVATQVQEVEDSLFATGQASLQAQLYKLDTATNELTLVIESAQRVLGLDDTASFVYIPFITNGSDEFLPEGGDYFVNVAFNGVWIDDIGRVASYDIGNVTDQKYSSEMCVRVAPQGTDWNGVSGSAGPAMALSMEYSDPYPNSEYDVTFSVTDENGDAVIGASVKAGGKQASTNGIGEATIPLEDGDYTYLIEYEGYGDSEGDFTVAGEAIEVEASIYPEYKVKFEIMDGAGDPVTNAKIEIDGEELFTDGTGTDSIYLVNGTYDYAISKLGFDSLSGTLEVADADVMIEQVIGYYVTFVVDDGTDVLEGASISINDEMYMTDASGEAEIYLGLAEYPYMVSLAGYEQFEGTLDVTGIGLTENVTLTEATETYAVNFTVLDGVDPVEGAAVTIAGYGEVMTDVDGLASFADVANGTYNYTITKDGYYDKEGTVTVEGAAVDMDVNITLVGISDANANDFNIYPNPSNGTFYLEVDGKSSVTIMNAAGKVVKTMVVNSTQQINLDAASGVYFVRVKEGGKVGVQRLIIK